jgi:hypothetical protein
LSFFFVVFKGNKFTYYLDIDAYNNESKKKEGEEKKREKKKRGLEGWSKKWEGERV